MCKKEAERLETGTYRYPLCLKLFNEPDEEYEKLLLSYYKKHVENNYDEDKIKAFLMIVSMNGQNANLNYISEAAFSSAPEWSCEMVQSKKPFIKESYCYVCELNKNNINKNKLIEEEVLGYFLQYPESYLRLGGHARENMEFLSKVLYCPNGNNYEAVLIPVLQIIFNIFKNQVEANEGLINRELIVKELNEYRHDDCSDNKIIIDYYNALMDLKVEEEKFIEHLGSLGIFAVDKSLNVNDNNSVTENKHDFQMPISILNDSNDNRINGNFIFDFINGLGEALSSTVSDYIETNNTDPNMINDNLAVEENKENSIDKSNDEEDSKDVKLNGKKETSEITIINTKEEFAQLHIALVRATIIYIALRDNKLDISVKTKKEYTYYTIPEPHNFKEEIIWLLSSLETPKIINSIKPIYKLIEPNIVLVKNLESLYVGEKTLTTSFKAVEVYERFVSDEEDKYSKMTFSEIINTYEKQARLIKKASLQEYYADAVKAYNLINYSCAIKPYGNTIRGKIDNSVTDAIYSNLPSECGSWSRLVTDCLVAILDSKITNYTDIRINKVTDTGFELECDDKYFFMLRELVNTTFIHIYEQIIISNSSPLITVKKHFL